MQKLQVMFKPERITIELSVAPEKDLQDAINMLLSLFPGAKVEGIGGPLGTVQQIAASLKGEEDLLGGFILRTPPYLTRRLDSVDLQELREWRQLDADMISAQEKTVIDKYLRQNNGR